MHKSVALRIAPPKKKLNYKLLILVLVQGFLLAAELGALLASSNCALCSIFWPPPQTAAAGVATTLILLMVFLLLRTLLPLSLQWWPQQPGRPLIHLSKGEKYLWAIDGTTHMHTWGKFNLAVRRNSLRKWGVFSRLRVVPAFLQSVGATLVMFLF